MKDDLTESEISPRQNSLYVAYDVWQLLGYVARASGQTRESVAEPILRKWAEHNHPELIAHLGKQKEADNQFRKELKSKLFGKDPLA